MKIGWYKKRESKLAKWRKLSPQEKASWNGFNGFCNGQLARDRKYTKRTKKSYKSLR